MTTGKDENTHGTDPVPRLKSATDIRHNPSEVAEIIDNMFDTYCADPSERIAKVRDALQADHRLRLMDALTEVHADGEDIYSMARPLIDGSHTDA